MSTQRSPVCPLALHSAVPSHNPHFIWYTEGIRAAEQATSLQILNEFQILEGALQMRQKINRRQDSFMVRVNEFHLCLAIKFFQKIRNLFIISFDVGYLLHYLKWRLILAGTSPEHTKHHSNAYHFHKCNFLADGKHPEDHTWKRSRQLRP